MRTATSRFSERPKPNTQDCTSPVGPLMIRRSRGWVCQGQDGWPGSRRRNAGSRTQATARCAPSLFFLLWNPQLFRADGNVPKRSYVLLAALSALSTVDFAVSWKWGLFYQGPPYTAVICSINIAWVGFLALAFRRSFKTITTFRTSLFLHWMLFAWLSWYAFPWLREFI